MDLVRWQPFDRRIGVQSRINDLFDDIFASARRYSTVDSTVWTPSVDLLESHDAYLIRAELPGMKREDVNVEFKEEVLTVSGERKYEEPAAGVEYHRSERAFGRFSRSFRLPKTIKQEDIKATYQDGLLEIHVPKADAAKARQIAITLN